MSRSCVVIGGGIIGLLTARELVRAGSAVTVLERGELGRESSWAGGGILSPLYPWAYPDPVNALTAWSQARYPELAAELAASTGVDPEWQRSGQLVLDHEQSGEALAFAQRYDRILGGSGLKAAECADHGLEQVTASRLRQLEPGLTAPSAGALWLPHVAQLRNPRLIRALRLELAARGVVLREGVEVTGFRSRQGHLDGLDTGAGAVDADCCVVAAGAWTGALLAPTGLVLPVRPVKGQMLLFRATAGALQHILIYRRHYLIPRRDGRILVGSSMEETGFEKSATTPVREALQRAAVELLPALATAPLEAHWAGLRPGSPSGIPFVDRHPGIDGLYVCSGHFRNGLAMAPASARLVADLVLQRSPLLDPAPFRINSMAEKGIVA